MLKGAFYLYVGRKRKKKEEKTKAQEIKKHVKIEYL